MPFFDGQQERIYYREWEVEHPVAGLLWLHGGGEHSGQYSRLAAALNGRGVSVWAPDHQGHGISGGAPHHSGGVANIAADVDQLLGIVRAAWPDLPLVVGGHSLGGWTTALTIARDASPFAGAVIVGASLRPVALAFESDDDNLYFDTSALAVDPGYLEELEKDPLVHLVIPKDAPIGSSLDDALPLLEAALPHVAIPVLLISGTKDVLAPIDAVRDWAARIPNARQLEIVDGLHNVVNDVDHRQVSAAIGDFVIEITAA